MKGNNELILNAATMIEAVQEWLDARMISSAAPIVTNVHQKTDGSGMFEVRLAERARASGEGE